MEWHHLLWSALFAYDDGMSPGRVDHSVLQPAMWRSDGLIMYGLIDIFSNWPISLITNWSTLVLISGTAQNKSQVEPVSQCTHHRTCCLWRGEKRTVILKHLWICSRNRLTHFLITRRRRDVTVCCVWLGVRLHYLYMLNSLLRFKPWALAGIFQRGMHRMHWLKSSMILWADGVKRSKQTLRDFFMF